MKLKFYVISLILSTQVCQFAMSQTDDNSFTVYCTGNQDSTGICLEISDSEDHKKLDCIMVPGNIIECQNEVKEQIECILIAATSAQSEFSCNKNSERSIDTQASTSIESSATQTIEDIDDAIYNKNTDQEIKFDATQTNIFNKPFE